MKRAGIAKSGSARDGCTLKYWLAIHSRIASAWFDLCSGLVSLLGSLIRFSLQRCGASAVRVGPRARHANRQRSSVKNEVRRERKRVSEHDRMRANKRARDPVGFAGREKMRGPKNKIAINALPLSKK